MTAQDPRFEPQPPFPVLECGARTLDQPVKKDCDHSLIPAVWDVALASLDSV